MVDVTFRPALCKCIFLVDENFVLNKVLFKCPMHAELEDQPCFDKVIEESQAIAQTPKLDGETDLEYQDRRWLLMDEEIKQHSGA